MHCIWSEPNPWEMANVNQDYMPAVRAHLYIALLLDTAFENGSLFTRIQEEDIAVSLHHDLLLVCERDLLKYSYFSCTICDLHVALYTLAQDRLLMDVRKFLSDTRDNSSINIWSRANYPLEFKLMQALGRHSKSHGSFLNPDRIVDLLAALQSVKPKLAIEDVRHIPSDIDDHVQMENHAEIMISPFDHCPLKIITSEQTTSTAIHRDWSAEKQPDRDAYTDALESRIDELLDLL